MPDIGAAADCGLLELITAAEVMVGRGEIERGLDLYGNWLRHHPADPQRHIGSFNHGVLLSQSGHVAEAAAAFAEAVRLQPAFMPAHINLGLAYERLGQLDRAVIQWLNVADRPVRLDADCVVHSTTALKHVGRVFKAVGDVGRAEEALQRSLDIDPHQRDAAQHWIAMRQMQCKWPVIAPRGQLTRTSLTAALSPLSLAIHTDDPLLQLANAWQHFELDVARSPSRAEAPFTAGRWIAPATRAQRPLRIGYVSPDLREHAIGFLTAELFELHDRARVEVFAYYSGRAGPDAMQARIRRAVEQETAEAGQSGHWRDIAGFTDRQAATLIVRDEIDILVDLGGYTGDAPTAAFALRPAPVLVNWLGYPGSMATPHHQYIIADAEVIPEAYEKYYTERVMRLPCYQPTDRKRVVAADLPPSRQQAGLPDDATVYCCFNGTQKITPAMFRRWMAILTQVPNAVLWLLSCDAATDERLRRQAVGHAVSPDRLVFAQRVANADHLARYPLADLFLDTAPYGAHTTASDALWMGVPALTIAGRSFASRVCASLVRAAGLPELVCDGADAYVARAIDLGSRPDRLRGFRERLRAGRDRCTLFDMPLLVTRLEALYAQMWDEHLSGRIPEPDLTNLAVYADIGARLDHEAEIPDLHTYEQRYATALAYRDSISPVPPDRRLWAGRDTTAAA